jgi:septal ring factor EnvC (AmiA/AmiB activator)
MLRISAAGALAVIALAISPPCFGQTVSNQSRDRRLAAAETEISLLKRLVKEQDRRIAELEKAINSLQAAFAAATEKPTPREVAKEVLKPAALRWQDPLAWAQIREGMSRAQVEDVLGKPASVESVIDYQTLTYKGDVPGSGTVTGVIKLTDDRVSEIHPPNF